MTVSSLSVGTKPESTPAYTGPSRSRTLGFATFDRTNTFSHQYTNAELLTWRNTDPDRQGYDLCNVPVVPSPNRRYRITPLDQDGLETFCTLFESKSELRHEIELPAFATSNNLLTDTVPLYTFELKDGHESLGHATRSDLPAKNLAIGHNPETGQPAFMAFGEYIDGEFSASTPNYRLDDCGWSPFRMLSEDPRLEGSAPTVGGKTVTEGQFWISDSCVALGGTREGETVGEIWLQPGTEGGVVEMQL